MIGMDEDVLTSPMSFRVFRLLCRPEMREGMAGTEKGQAVASGMRSGEAGGMSMVCLASKGSLMGCRAPSLAG